MAKENFERTKPHVNVGTVGHTQQIEGPAGLLLDSAESTSAGNPPQSYLLTVEAGTSFVPQTTTVIIPIDNEFFFRQATGPAESIAFSVDVISNVFDGTGDIEVSLGILQGEFFVARESASYDPPSIGGSSSQWTSLQSPRPLTADDFEEADGGPGAPDFSQPFQFGYTFTSQSLTSAFDLELGLDNMTVEIVTIPEPTTLGLAVSLGAAFLWSRWRRED